MKKAGRVFSKLASLPLAIKVSVFAHKPLKDSLRMAEAMRAHGASFQQCSKEGLLAMDGSEFRRYLKSRNPRTFAKAIAAHNGTTEYEVYKQMVRAKCEYGISYSTFNRFGLYGASDEKLKLRMTRLGKKRGDAIKKIADACGISESEASDLASRLNDKYSISATSVYKHHLYNATDEEIEAFLARRKDSKDHKYQLAIEETGWSEGQLEGHMAKCLNEFHIVNDYYFSLRCYKLSDECLAKALTHDDIYKLCACFNRKTRRVDNKKEFNANFRDYLGRRYWVNRETTFDEFSDFVNGLSEVFVKPVDGMHGVGAYKLDIGDRDLRDVYDELMKEKESVVEEVITQNPAMAAFNPASVNTVRLYTICGDDGNVDYVNAYVRFGNGDAVDNFSSGGFECGVDPKTGTVNTNAICKNGETFSAHPLTGLEFEGFHIPLWDDVLARTKDALLSIEGINFVGWDVALTSEHSILIEGNCRPGPGAYQRFVLENGESIRKPFERYLEMADERSKTERRL